MRNVFSPSKEVAAILGRDLELDEIIAVSKEIKTGLVNPFDIIVKLDLI